MEIQADNNQHANINIGHHCIMIIMIIICQLLNIRINDIIRIWMI